MTDATKDAKALSEGLPFDLAVVHEIPTMDCRKLEAKLHDKFADKKLRGEWFALSSEDVEVIQSVEGAP